MFEYLKLRRLLWESLWKSFWTSTKAEKEITTKLTDDIIKWYNENPGNREELIKFNEPYFDELRRINEHYGLMVRDCFYSGKNFTSVLLSMDICENNTVHSVAVNDVARRYYNDLQQFRVPSRTLSNDASLVTVDTLSALKNDIVNERIQWRIRNNMPRRSTYKHPDSQRILAQINLNNAHKMAHYDDLLEQFKAEHDYAASTKGKVRAASKAIIPFFPGKKEFVQLHEQVIHAASEINDDYQELKNIIHQLQIHADKFTSETSKQQILDTYTAYKPLSYREDLEKNIRSLTRGTEQEHDSNGFEIMNESRRLLRA